MNLAAVTHEISNAGGGVAEVVRALRNNQYGNQQTTIFGFDANSISRDVAEPHGIISVQTVGPRAFGYSPGLRRALLNGNYDVLHLHGLWRFPSKAALDWQRITGKPKIVSPHGMLDPWALRRSVFKKRLARIAFEDQNLATASCFHALCDEECDAIRAADLRQPVCIIPNGVELPVPPPVEEAADVILYLGRIHPKKGVYELVESWRSLPDPLVKRWKLKIVGWGEKGHVARLKTLLNNLPTNVAVNVEFCGAKYGAEKSTCFAECAGFILPSFSEGVPMSVLEAWAHCKPVIMSSACNLEQGFARGAAWRAEPTIKSILDELVNFMTLSPEQRCAAGRNGRRLVQEQYSWRIVAETMFHVYKWLIEGGNAPACVQFV